MRNSILFMMSLSGSVVFILYIFIYPIAKRFFTVKWRYNILKLALLFFLFPFPCFKYKIKEYITAIPLPELTSDLPKRYYYSDLIIHLEDDFYASHNIEKRIVYLIFAGCVAAIILCIQIYQYFELRRILNQLSAENNVETPEYISGYIADLKATLNIHTKVSLVFSPYIEVPSVIGLARSVIYIPESYLARFSSESIKIIIMHEMIHVKHRDLRVKFLALFAIALNWFNPLCYCLFYEICNISEIYCDEAMIHNKEQDFISRYGNLLINISEEERSKMKNRFISRLVNNGGSILKKRILEMKTKRKRTLKKLSVLVGMLICTVGTSTVFAYDNTPQMEILGEGSLEDIQLNSSQWADFNPEGTLEELEEIPFDNFFTDENGNIFETDAGISKEKSACIHKYVSGTLSNHTIIGKKCTVDVYKAKRCSLCRNVIRKEHLYTITYDICPH